MHRPRFTFAVALLALSAALLVPRAGGADASPVGDPPGGPLAPQATNVGFEAITPARLLDTRSEEPTVDGNFWRLGPVGPLGTISFDVLGRGGVPTSGVDTVVLNVTAVDPTDRGFLTVWPTGETRPLASSLNFAPGQNVPNLVFAKVGTGGQVSIFNFAGETDVVADVVGFVSTNGVRSLVPSRLLDTRPDGVTADGAHARSGALAGGGVYDLQVLNRVGVPAVGVDSVVLNVTVDTPTERGYLTVWPNGAERPTASNLNFTPQLTVANLVVAKVGLDGIVRLFNSHGATHVVVDVVGYFPASAAFESVVPARLLDTRAGQPTIDATAAGVGPLDAQEAWALPVVGRGGVPATGVGAVVVNVTVADPTEDGFVTVWPEDDDFPTASNLNFEPGQTVANLVVARVSEDGRIGIFNSSGSTHVIVDVVGFVPETDPLAYRVDELPPGRAGTPYSHALGASGGDEPYTWTSGILPSGLTVNAGTGTLAGTPTTVGTRNVLLRAHDVFGRTAIRHAGHTVFPADSGYLPVAPAGVLDVSDLGTAATAQFVAAGRAGVPADAEAVVLAVSTSSIAEGYLTVYPAGSAPPSIASSAVGPGIRSNLVVVPVGAGGAVRVFTAQPLVGLFVEVFGYFGPGSAYTPTTGSRVLDTRFPPPGSPIPAGTSRTFSHGLPASATAAVVQITTVDRSGSGFLRAWSGPTEPAGPTMQLSSAAGTTLRTALLPIVDGSFTVHVDMAAHVIVDVVGYLVDPAG